MDFHCSECGEPARLVEGSYQYKESGLDNVTLSEIKLIHCDSCGTEDPIIPNASELHSLIAEAIIGKPERLRGKELRFLRKFLELNSRTLAKLVHVDPATVSKWENEADEIGVQSDLIIRALVASKKEENFLELAKKLEAWDGEACPLGIIIDTQTRHFEYA